MIFTGDAVKADVISLVQWLSILSSRCVLCGKPNNNYKNKFPILKSVYGSYKSSFHLSTYDMTTSMTQWFAMQCCCWMRRPRVQFPVRPNSEMNFSTLFLIWVFWVSQSGFRCFSTLYFGSTGISLICDQSNWCEFLTYFYCYS